MPPWISSRENMIVLPIVLDLWFAEPKSYEAIAVGGREVNIFFATQTYLNCIGKCMLRIKSAYDVPPNPNFSSNCSNLSML